MSLQAHLLCEAASTDVTLEGFRLGVYETVGRQVVFQGERLVTDVTGEVSTAGVSQHVSLELGALTERLAALRTLVALV